MILRFSNITISLKTQDSFVCHVFLFSFPRLIQGHVWLPTFMLHGHLLFCSERVELLPPLLSSVPPLPDDSAGEEDGIMGIFVRWSSIIFHRECLLDWWSIQIGTSSSSLVFKITRYYVWGQHTKSPGLFCCSKHTWESLKSAGPALVPSGQMVGQAFTVLQSLVRSCRWSGVLPWAQADTCCTSTGCVSSLWPSGSVTVCGCSSVAAPQKGAQRVEGED